jgi:hypothetical protein
MFPHLEADRDEGRTPPAGGLQARCAAPALGLPNKATCTVREAHACTGISERQFNYYVDDGTLLAINSARVPVGRRVGKRKGGKLNRWRIVVRRGDEFKADHFAAFLTLEEFVRSRMNTED